jgi:hypothetical protein
MNARTWHTRPSEANVKIEWNARRMHWASGLGSLLRSSPNVRAHRPRC